MINIYIYIYIYISVPFEDGQKVRILEQKKKW